jgi:hypothetical protein
MAAIYNYDREIGEDASSHMALAASASPLKGRGEEPTALIQLAAFGQSFL